MNLIKVVISVSFLILLGRISGFIREWVIAYKVGASYLSDYAMILITLPDLLVTLIIGGGFAAAVIPEFKSLKAKDANRLFLQLFAALGCLFLIAAILVSIFDNKFIFLLGPGLPRDFIDQYSVYFLIASLAIPLTALSGVLKARMDSDNLFLYGAVGTLIFNTAIIIFISVYTSLYFIQSLAVGILVGALIRLFIQFFGTNRKSYFSYKNSNFNGLNKNFILAIFSAISFSSLIIILPIVVRSILSIDSEGALTLFTFAWRVNEVPVGLIFGPLVTVVLPYVSTVYNSKNIIDTKATIIIFLRAAFIISIAISIPMIFYSHTIIEFIFASTELTDQQIKIVGTLTLISFIFLTFKALLAILFAILSAVKGAKYLFQISLLILTITIVLSFVLVNYLDIYGGMLAYSLSNLIGTLILYFMLCKKLGNKVFTEVFSNFMKTFILPCIISILINYVGAKYLPNIYSFILLGGLSLVVFYYIFYLNDQLNTYNKLRKVSFQK
tara:strand:- start:18891 stop:20387 length:1497 start_codon:yes stop_codon:yes gene_type:complete